jgi:alpha-tubulin suppressor-like RCC1 family protein
MKYQRGDFMRKMFAMLSCIWLLAACGGGGGGGGSNTSTPSTSVASPTGISTFSSANKITMTWNPVVGATSYNIYWSTSPGVTKNNVGKIVNAASPYVQSQTIDKVTYYYVVTALKDGVESDISAEQNITSSKIVSFDSIAGTDNLIALKSDGSVWVFEGYEDLILNTTTSNVVPRQIVGLSNVIKVATAGTSYFALKSDGTLWSWGTNAYGVLGDGTIVDKSTPVQINIADVIDISSGGGSTAFALKRDGTVWGWGWNGPYGNIGYGGAGNNDFKTAPAQVTNLTNIVAIRAGARNSAISSNGTLWQWGGYSNPVNILPYIVSGITNVKDVQGGDNGSYVVKTDGTLWAWGNSAIYNISDKVYTATTSIPTQVSGIYNVSSITKSGFCLIKNDGTIWTTYLDATLWVTKLIKINTAYGVISGTGGLILLSDGSLIGYNDPTNPIYFTKL